MKKKTEMKKIILFLTLLFIFQPESVLAQSNLSFGVDISSESSFVLSIKDSYAPDDIDEKGKLGFGFGIGGFAIRKMAFGFFRGGAKVGLSNYQHRIDGLRFDSDYDFSTGKRYKSYIENSMKVVTLNIPIEIAINLFSINGNLDLYLGIGGEYNVLLNENFKSELVHENIQNKSLTSDGEVSVSPFTGIGFIGLRFKERKGVEFLIEPYLKYNPTDFILDVYSSEAESYLQLGVSVKGNFVGKEKR